MAQLKPSTFFKNGCKFIEKKNKFCHLVSHQQEQNYSTLFTEKKNIVHFIYFFFFLIRLFKVSLQILQKLFTYQIQLAN